MRRAVLASVVATGLILPAAAEEEPLHLICQCTSVVVNGQERGCTEQPDRIVVIDFALRSLQWSDGPGHRWDPVATTITRDRFETILPPGLVHRIPGRIAVERYAIDRKTGAFEQNGTGRIPDPAMPQYTIPAPASVRGICRINAIRF